MKTGLLFGSFNPIHNGHLIIANYILQYTDINEIILVVSPQNPFKKDNELLDKSIRIKLAEMALEGNKNIRPSDIEFSMSLPSYTIDTIKKFMTIKPDNDYVLIIGSDNQDSLDLWKDYKELLSLVDVYVYPRPGYKPQKFKAHPKIIAVNAPLLEISSTKIRSMLKEGKDPRYLLPDKVYAEVLIKKFYK